LVTQHDIEAETEQATKIVNAERKSSKKASKTAEKLKPSVDEAETQIGRIDNLISVALPGSAKEQAL
jgi:hypothetical protein